MHLILTGTGLERLQDKTLEVGHQYGTNPDKAFVVMMGKPKRTELNLPSVLENAIKNGLYSRVLAMNSRMFFRAVLPILDQPQHCLDVEGYPITVEDRIKQVGSFLPIMDYAVRFYLNQNTVLKLDGSE